MKRLLLLSTFIFVFATSNAQDFKPFQLYIGLGYTAPADGGGGILFDIEPAYRINDNLAVGLRFESAAMAKNISSTSGGASIEASVSAVGSYTVNGRYYLGSGGFRPYVGAGLGLYSLGNVSLDTSIGSGEIEAGSKFGFYPRVGFDAGHFNINIDYNIVPSFEDNGSEIKNSYIGFRIGAFIFGGRN